MRLKLKQCCLDLGSFGQTSFNVFHGRKSTKLGIICLVFWNSYKILTSSPYLQKPYLLKFLHISVLNLWSHGVLIFNLSSWFSPYYFWVISVDFLDKLFKPWNYWSKDLTDKSWSISWSVSQLRDGPMMSSI